MALHNRAKRRGSPRGCTVRNRGGWRDTPGGEGWMPAFAGKTVVQRSAVAAGRTSEGVSRQRWQRTPAFRTHPEGGAVPTPPVHPECPGGGSGQWSVGASRPGALAGCTTPFALSAPTLRRGVSKGRTRPVLRVGRHWLERCARPSIRAGQSPGATQGERVVCPINSEQLHLNRCVRQSARQEASRTRLRLRSFSLSCRLSSQVTSGARSVLAPVARTTQAISTRVPSPSGVKK